MKHLEGLNEPQKEAVLHTEGPLLIIAGAGAGKTRVITHRILHLIKKGVPGNKILAITFTNKAAKEMRERVNKLLSSEVGTLESPISKTYQLTNLQTPQLPWIGTFHALGVHILRENSRRLGIPSHFKIFDKGDSLHAVKEGVKRANLDPKSFEPGKILSAISREKGKMVALPEFRERAAGEYMPSIIAEVWGYYEQVLHEEHAFDFDDLLLRATLLLQKDLDVRTHYQNTWEYLHVDEYQDTNHVQYVMTKLLAERDHHIAVVGDIDQNIYSWRGASIKNILNFEKDYPTAKIVLLEENYRSTQMILTVANRIIEKNKLRREKRLFTKNAEGEKIGLFTAYDEIGEASFIAHKSKELIGNGVEPREIAILFRANFQSRVLEEYFLREEIPYQVLGTRFFERKEIKDVVSYVRAALTPEQTAGFTDLSRIINVPPRGIGKVTLLKILSGKEHELGGAMREKIAAFRRLLGTLKQKLDAEPLSGAIKWIVTASGLEEELKRGGPDDEERLENIKELVTYATRYDALDREEGVQKFLADIALSSDQDELKEEKNAVRLMTIHASKGLEFEQVFISGLEEGLFPHERVNETPDESAGEEERRLFYVALTRAKKKVFLSYAGVRTLFGSRQVNVPSEFIFDIDEEFIETEEKFEGGGKIIYFE